jgi:hypothetical protein
MQEVCHSDEGIYFRNIKVDSSLPSLHSERQSER